MIKIDNLNNTRLNINLSNFTFYENDCSFLRYLLETGFHISWYPISLNPYASYIDKTATLTNNVQIPKNAIICESVIIKERVTAGKNLVIGANSYIGPGTILGDNVIIGPECIISAANKKNRERYYLPKKSYNKFINIQFNNRNEKFN